MRGFDRPQPQQQQPQRRPGLRRSVELFRAFRVEQTDPARFYGLVARDTVAQVSQWIDLAGQRVLDVGGGPGYFADAFTAAGASYAGLEPDAGELTAAGITGQNTLRGSGLALPIADAAVDVAFSSNVLEHVPQPRSMADEMVRITRPGGLIYLSWTPWLSPWGGHETSPWHYLGGHRAANRYADRMGHRPKNDFGTSLFACPISEMLDWSAAAQAGGLIRRIAVLPRYHPWWAHWVITVPGVREVVSWNAVIVLEKR